MTTLAATKLTTEQARRFEENGYLFPMRALNEDEQKRYLANYMDYSARNKVRLDALPPNQKYKVLTETHFVLPWVHEIVSHPRILDAVESLLGPNLLAWSTAWFTKMPGEKTYISWHQDGAYWKMNPATIVTAWVALSPCTIANGCMRVVPGTHKSPALPQRDTYAPDNALSRGQEIAVEVDENKAVDLLLQPGEMSLHHIWIVHGSNANTSTTPRIGIAIRYVPTNVVQESPTKPFAMLVRGRDEYGNFELLPPPTRNDPASEADRHTEIVNRIRSSVMVGAPKSS